MLDKTVGCINWSKSARDVHNLVRGTNPWPVAFTYYKGQKMKVWVTSVLDEENHNFTPGTILKVARMALLLPAVLEKLL